MADDARAPHLVGHVHLKVRDLAPAVDFYTGVLGLGVTEYQGRYAFLSWGERHHDVALQAVGAGADGPGSGVGLYHAAFEVATPDALATVHERLRERDVRVSPVDHGISKALYFDDPDGNGLEVYLDTRESGDGKWAGQNERFDPADLAEE
ncbi:biphenyl-2,3-diol 1,2-dioxygenase [Halobacteriales archaeon QS_4_69_31]|nr:MAG: biphenyl-2,3-diol 1,2-dioxygenase [Halobacteriales archaeon QS_4_69_31]